MAAFTEAPDGGMAGARGRGWFREPAPAKLNLTLRVTGRRPDGLHLLRSLVVFAELGDAVSVRPSRETSLSVAGPMAAGVPDGPDNLAWRAADFLGVAAGIAVEKRLPAAAGIGGGSADAAAAVRALCRATGRRLPDPASLAGLGADVPVCLASAPSLVSGIGEAVAPAPALPPLHLVLANPNRPVPTGAAFAALAKAREGAGAPPGGGAAFPDRPDLPALARWLAGEGNDLEAPARSLCPEIGDALALLAGTGECLLARMSGSGATCFALHAARGAAERAAREVAKARPGWWVAATSARTGGLAEVPAREPAR